MNIKIEQNGASKILVLEFENKKEKEIFMDIFVTYSSITQIDTINRLIERNKNSEKKEELSIVIFENEIAQFIELLIYGSLYEKTNLLKDQSSIMKELSTSYNKHAKLLEKYKSLNKRYDELLIKYNSIIQK